MDFTGVPDSTVGATTEVGFTGDLALLNGDAGLKGTGDSSTAASEMAIAAFTATGISVDVPADSTRAAGISVEVPADSMRATGISVEAPADSTAAMVDMGVAEATAEGTGSFPAFSI